MWIKSVLCVGGWGGGIQWYIFGCSAFLSLGDINHCIHHSCHFHLTANRNRRGIHQDQHTEDLRGGQAFFSASGGHKNILFTVRQLPQHVQKGASGRTGRGSDSRIAAPPRRRKASDQKSETFVKGECHAVEEDRKCSTQFSTGNAFSDFV